MLIIRPLDSSHDRAGLDCGVPALNEFLRKTARQHREKGLSNSFVLLGNAVSSSILGFFTLMFLKVNSDTIPTKYSRRFPNPSQLPAAKLARLAVDKRFQGKGYGAILLADAVRRVVSLRLLNPVGLSVCSSMPRTIRPDNFTFVSASFPNRMLRCRCFCH